MKVAFKVDNLNEMSAALASLAEELRARQLCDDDVFASRLVSCELLTNVIRHSGEEAELVAELFSERIVITVIAKGLDGVNINTKVPDVFAESGRGLYIIRCFGEISPAAEGGLTVCIKLHD